MDLDVLKNGKERKSYTKYINKLVKDIKQLHDDILKDDHFNGKIFMIGDRIMVLKCHKYLQVNLVFEKQPNQTEISLERKHFNLVTLKLSNDEAMQFVKRLLHDEIVVVEYHRILTTLFPSLFVKLLQVEKYEEEKKKYLNRKTIKIYTGSKIIQ